MMQYELAAGTHVGLVRTNNEDNFVVNADLSKDAWVVPTTDDPLDLGSYGTLLVVADGMGGANAGEVASAIAIETIQREFAADKLQERFPISDEGVSTYDDEEFVQFMCAAVKCADINIVNHSHEDSSTQGMGTTVVMAWVLHGKVYVVWCGDSRCYLFNEKSGLIRLSKDHSYVQELVDAGKLSEDNAFDHPYSNIITRCLGDQERRAEPDYRIHTLQQGDVLLLCSDGLHGLCRDEEIMMLISEQTAQPLEVCRDALIQAALDAGGHDNVTVALCRITDIKGDDSDIQLGNTLPFHRSTKRHLPLWLFIALLVVCASVYFLTRYGDVVASWLQR